MACLTHNDKELPTMYRVPGVLSAATTPAPAVPPVQPARNPTPGNPQVPPGHDDSSARATHGPTEDRERIAAGLDDVVACRLRTAGLDLQAALGLMGDHPASGKIRHAVNELEQAIREIQDTSFDHPGA
jgi:hypothetical protein